MTAGRALVVHVIGSLGVGGAERQLVNYLAAADRTTFDHAVLCLSSRGGFADEVASWGIPVHVVPARFSRLPRDLGRIVGLLRRGDAQVIHTHMHASALWGRLAGLVAGVPVLVTTEHGKENWKGPVRVAIDRALTKRTFRHLAVSQDVMRIRMARERVAAARIELVPNGVPIPDLGQASTLRAEARADLGIPLGRTVIGSVGRVVDAKAYPDLLDAVARLRERRPDICWLQVGDGPLRADLAAEVERRGLAGTVLMAGNRDDVSRLLQAMDVWVMSSIREGLPVSLLEAMAACRPIVATDVGGIPDAVTDGRSALLVPASDAGALAGAIDRVLSDRDLAERLAAAARERVVRDYSIDAVARRIEAIYREGLRLKGRPVT